MAVDYYENRLKALLENPSSFQTSPGYQFAVDQGLKAAMRAGASRRGSGNMLAELTRLGAGYAAQEYGSQADRLARLLSGEQQYALGLGGLDANRRASDQQFGLGMLRTANDFTLGSRAADTAQDRAEWDYELGSDRNANDAERNWWDAQTNWRNLQSQDRARRAQTRQDWWKLMGS